MLSVVLGATGALLAGLAVWFRVGTSGPARWWLRSEPGTARKVTESVALLLTPYFAQFGSLSSATWGRALVLAIATLPVFHEVFAAAAVLAEFLLGAIYVSPLRYRRMLPLWLYPAWLRPDREQEQDELRRQRDL